MKRLLSIFLAVAMILTCCLGSVGAVYTDKSSETKYLVYEDGNYYTVNGEQQTITLPGKYTYVDNTAYDGMDYINYLIENKVEVLGIPIDYLYNSKSTTFFWKELTTYSNVVNAEGLPVDIAKSDIALAVGNINTYILRILKSNYSDFRMYTDANAVALINLFGKLFYPNFNEVKVTKVFKDSDYIYTQNGVAYADEDVFYQTVAEMSGLSNLIQINWVDRGHAVDFKPLLSLLGVAEGTLLESEYFRGDKIAPKLLESAFLKILSEGPINYFVNVLVGLSDAYQLYYYNAIAALFSQKLNSNYISEDELKTLDGLLNLIFNDNRNDPMKFQFAPLPELKLTNAADITEYYLYLFIYCNINAHYKNNATVIGNFKQDVQNSSLISGETTTAEDGTVIASDKERVIQIIDMITGNDIEKMFYEELLADLTTENFDNKFDEYKNNIKESLARMVKWIADWLQMWIKIFTGELEFGAGAFD